MWTLEDLTWKRERERERGEAGRKKHIWISYIFRRAKSSGQ